MCCVCILDCIPSKTSSTCHLTASVSFCQVYLQDSCSCASVWVSESVCVCACVYVCTWVHLQPLLKRSIRDATCVYSLSSAHWVYFNRINCSYQPKSDAQAKQAPDRQGEPWRVFNNTKAHTGCRVQGTLRSQGRFPREGKLFFFQISFQCSEFAFQLHTRCLSTTLPPIISGEER